MAQSENVRGRETETEMERAPQNGPKVRTSDFSRPYEISRIMFC